MSYHQKWGWKIQALDGNQPLEVKGERDTVVSCYVHTWLDESLVFQLVIGSYSEGKDLQ